MRAYRVAIRCALPLLALAASGCGTSSSAPAQSRTVALRWHEAAGRPGWRMTIDVRRLVVRSNGWTVDASIENDAGVALAIGRPHHEGKTEFGVLVLETADESEIAHLGPGLLAATFAPDLPRILQPNASWSGTFSGRGRLPSAHYVRVVFGRFRVFGTPPRGLPVRFRYITDHVYRIP